MTGLTIRPIRIDQSKILKHQNESLNLISLDRLIQQTNNSTLPIYFMEKMIELSKSVTLARRSPVHLQTRIQRLDHFTNKCFSILERSNLGLTIMHLPYLNKCYELSLVQSNISSSQFRKIDFNISPGIQTGLLNSIGIIKYINCSFISHSNCVEPVTFNKFNPSVLTQKIFKNDNNTGIAVVIHR